MVGRSAFDLGQMGKRRRGGGLALLLCLAAVALSACGQQGQSANLAIVCETENCSCHKDSGFTKKPPPVQWKTDGTAYCPEGYSLYLPPPPSQRYTVGPGIE
jgi:hypothetical protein